MTQTNENAPRVFFSYSHDSERHKLWVRNLATRLLANGVDVILDQWDANIGGDLPVFMEENLNDSNRVIAICSDKYVLKANDGRGGVGYEKMILSGGLMKDINSSKIIPIVYGNSSDDLTPRFLESKQFIDFRSSDSFEEKYAQLLFEIHGRSINPRPKLGPSPFQGTTDAIERSVAMIKAKHIVADFEGQSKFNYSSNNGSFVVGEGELLFELKFSEASNTCIHAYTDADSITNVAIAFNVSEISDLKNGSQFDFSSRVVTPQIDEIVMWRNTNGFICASKIIGIKCLRRGDIETCLEIKYKVFFDKSHPIYN